MKDVSEIYDDSMYALFCKYADDYRADPEMVIGLLHNSIVPKKIVMGFYKKFVAEGLPDIDSLSRDEKWKLANECGLAIPKDVYRAVYALKHRNTEVYVQ